MKGKIVWSLCLMLLVLLSSSMALGFEKKLGYGFGAGLVPGTDFVAGQLIVGLKEGASPNGVKQLVAATGVEVRKEISGALLLQFASEQAVSEAVPALISRADVAFVERNGFMSSPAGAKGTKEDCGACTRATKGEVSPQSVSSTSWAYQWHHTVIRKIESLGSITSTPYTVAVIDTGVDYLHPDLYYGKVILGKNCIDNNMDPMDDNGNGTHAAGLIAAYQGSDYGEGVSHNSKVLAIKVLDRNGKGTFIDIADGMQYAIDQKTATDPDTMVVYLGLIGPNNATVAAKVLAIKNAQMMSVAPAGDDNTTATTNAFPGADANTTLRVMATEATDCRAWFSNFSPATAATQYNIAAPGWNIYSTLPRAGYGPRSSTAAAAAIIAGGAALVWGQFPIAFPPGIVTRLVGRGQPIKCGFAPTTTAFRLDVRKAIMTSFETALIGTVFDPFTGLPVGVGPYGGAYYPFIRLYAPTSPSPTYLGGSYVYGGAYNIVLPTTAAGIDRYITGERSGYITTPLRGKINIVANKVVGPYMDAFPRSQADGNATIVFDWKNIQPSVSTTGCTGACLGWEFDLYVKRPAGGYIGKGNPGSLAASPYVKWPRDSVDDLLPMETIVIGDKAANGLYRVFVDKAPYTAPAKWNPSWVGSLASFQAYNGGTSGLTLPYYNKNCNLARYWYIGDLTKTGTTYTWTLKDKCQNTKP